MDVDLLRPGTVPISPDTILWFEFLLDPELLRRHISKDAPDPSPTDLINEFYMVAPNQELNKPVEVDSPNSPTLPPVTEKYTKKQLALKILSLKIAAHLKWNLDILEKGVSPQHQCQLMHDLVYMATDCTFSNPPEEIPLKLQSADHVKFALVMLYRWYLRFSVNAALLAKPSKVPFVLVPGMPVDTSYSQLNPHFEKLLNRAEAIRMQAITYLTDVLESDTSSMKKEHYLIKVPVMDTFKNLTENEPELNPDWEVSSVYVSQQEMFMQINYDLTYNYFFHGQYDLAKKHIMKCYNHMVTLGKEIEYFNTKSWGSFNYASVKKEHICGYIRALNLSKEILNEPYSLLHELQETVCNNYANILSVLQADNLKMEIPLVYRLNVELDIQGSAAMGLFTVSRDLLVKVSVLNVVRSVLEGELPSIKPDFIKKLNSMGMKYIDLLMWAYAPVLQSIIGKPTNEKLLENVRNFFLHLMITQPIVTVDILSDFFGKYFGSSSKAIWDVVFEKSALEKIRIYQKESQDDVNMPRELLNNDWNTDDFDVKGVSELEIGTLKQRLIDAWTAEDIRICLVNLAITNPSLPLWKVNTRWLLQIPLQSVVLSLPRGFLQDFSYIILGKARQCAEIGDFKAALELLTVLEAETMSQLNESGAGSNIFKLCRLIGWEVLLVQIGRLLNDWTEQSLSLPALAARSRVAVGPHDGLAPRIQVVEWALVCLLNAREYETVATTWQQNGTSGGHLAGSQIAEMCARAASELARIQSQRLPTRDLWELVLSIFSTPSSNATKRNNTGNSVYSNRDNIAAQTKTRENFNSFLQKLREPFLTTVLASLLAKIHNILKDNSNIDLNIEYINLWPTSINNAANYNLNLISESLSVLLTQALKYHPQNISFLKLTGDLYLANNHHTNALRQYLISLTIISDFFVQPLTKNLVEDQSIYRKMIKCCAQLNCPTQAAILCQFLDDVDYALAFKCFSEKSNTICDSMDSYYGCIWDTTLLEFLVNLHHKRGETHRKQLAIKVMGLLELNSNNNDEIQREAANSRKAKFMRALVQQYV